MVRWLALLLIGLGNLLSMPPVQGQADVFVRLRPPSSSAALRPRPRVLSIHTNLSVADPDDCPATIARRPFSCHNTSQQLGGTRHERKQGFCPSPCRETPPVSCSSSSS